MMARKVSRLRVERLQARFAEREGLDEKYLPYLAAQIGQETGFQTNIGSPAGARDVAQFMPETARRYGVTLGDNRIKDDIRGQVRMMAPLIKKYGIRGALRAYNAGEGNMNAGFGETRNYERTIMAAADRYKIPELGSGPGAKFKSPQRVGSFDPGRAPTLTPGGEVLDAKSAMLDALLDDRKDRSLLDRFQQRVNSGQYTTIQAPKIDPGRAPRYFDPQKQSGHGQPGSPSGAVGQGGLPPSVAALKAEADRIDQAQVPYLWGGGHQTKIPRGSKVTPMDCSGAVSRLLGINPLVSGQFASWGKPGRGKNFTVYANGEHVLVEIAGHFWGTSASNPGGGAGWIPRSQISKAYLSRFKARHM